MNSSFVLSTITATIGFFMLFKKFRLFHQENKENDSPSLSPLSPVPPSSSSHSWRHQVFPSFRGEDIRRDFLSHIQKEFRTKGITLFSDNGIKRGESITPELVQAIRSSKIAIILLSRNYASSSWCLDELAEIIKCREEFGQTVMVVFKKVDPSDVKKLTGDFGSAFRKACAGKTKEDIGRWIQALAKVATLAGYVSNNWDNEAIMIEKIASDVSNLLNNFTPSRDIDELVGMGAHMEMMEQLLCLDADEVRMVGIWGPSGIGKTIIARFLFSQFSDSFELSAFMENIQELMYTRPMCSDDYNAKLHLQSHFMSKITNHMDIEVPHLGVAEIRLNDKKVLVVLDNIDQSMQLDAIAKETRWFGHGSRIIITTQDHKILKAHGINHIYKVDFPSTHEACQIFCMSAFGQKFPEVEYQELALEVTNILGNLPLGLRVMGSHFRGMSKQEWINAMPRLRTHLDSNIQSILKFSYDALCDEDQDLFLHIACLFNNKRIENVEEYLAHKLLDVKQGFHVLAEKSLISIEEGWIKMHNLLEQLGREIVRYESGFIREPGKRQFLVDGIDICEVLTDHTDSRNIIGIHLNSSELLGELIISEKAFKGMSNLQFLRIKCGRSEKVYLPQGLKYLSQKLRLLEWDHFPMTCLPSKFCAKYIVELSLQHSKLEKMWEGHMPLVNLKRMNLFHSKNLKELPDFSTATNLQTLILCGCSSLVELPYSIGNAINLQKLHLCRCTGLVELPNSIVNLHKLQNVTLKGCSKLKALPTNINLILSTKHKYRESELSKLLH
ncbi:disease resistance protein TAO1 [Capsella rubella]|uniref:disease resistance protein TAO1 n=1 Tax=Capsella rubella TaxID=81985 RepID=UPI000CD4B5C9|nr:disease resistance protein TAO1 [Capsella rubella]